MTDIRDRFQRSAPAAATGATPGTRGTSGPRRSRFDNVEPSRPRVPMLPPGLYAVEWLQGSPTRLRDGYKISLRVQAIEEGGAGVAPGHDQTVRVGDMVQVVQKTTNDTGMSAIVAMVMAFAGHETAADFHDSVSGALLEDCCEGIRDDLVGRVALVSVTRGKACVKDDAPTGDYYRNYDWASNGDAPIAGDL